MVISSLLGLISGAHSLFPRMYNMRFLVEEIGAISESIEAQLPKIIKYIYTRFPEPLSVDKLHSLESTLFNPASSIQTIISPHFQTLLDVLTFKEHALAVLLEMPNIVSVFDSALNPDISELFYNLLTYWIQIQYQLNQIQERKLVFGLYQCIYFQSKTDASKLTLFLKSNDEDPFKKMREELKPLTCIAMSGLNTFLDQFNNVRDFKKLSNDAVLSILTHSNRICQPETNQIYLDLLRSPNILQWFQIGLISFPENLLKISPQDKLLQVSLFESSAALSFRDMTLPLYKEVEELLSYKGSTGPISGKIRKLIKDGLNDSYLRSSSVHSGTLLYIFHTLIIIYNVISDTPALAAPKLPLILAALVLAKEELLWYFHHRWLASNTKISGKFISPSLDHYVPQVIHWSIKIQYILRENKLNIETYYIEYLQKADSDYLARQIKNPVFINTFRPEILVVIQWFLEWILVAQSGRDFSKVRDKWFEMQTHFAFPLSSPPDYQVVKPFVERVRQIMFHTRIVESFDNVLSEYASLRQLAFFNTDLYVNYEILLTNKRLVDALPCTISYIMLMSQHVENATIFNPSEKETFGTQALTNVTDFMQLSSRYLVQTLCNIIDHQVKFNLRREIPLSNDLQKKHRHLKKDKHMYYQNNLFSEMTRATKPLSQESNTISSQSTSAGPYISRIGLDIIMNLSELRTYYCSLCQAFKTLDIIIYNKLFSPREFLAVKMKYFFRSIISHSSFVTFPNTTSESTRQTLVIPSELFAKISICMSELKQLDHFTFSMMSKHISQVLHDQLFMMPLGATQINSNNAMLTSLKPQGSFIQLISAWYVNAFMDFICTPSVSSTSNIATNPASYSMSHQTFYLKPGQPFSPEGYFGILQLCELATMIGPYGIKVIDYDLIKLLSCRFQMIINLIKTFEHTLSLIPQDNFYEAISTQSKNLKPITFDAIFEHLVVIGNILIFHNLLFKALSMVQVNRIPHIHNAIGIVSKQCASLYATTNLVSFRHFSKFTGLQALIHDHSIITAFLPIIQLNKTILPHLPLVYSLTFLFSRNWKESVCNPTSNTLSGTIYALSYAIHDLITLFSFLSSDAQDTNYDDSITVEKLASFAKTTLGIIMYKTDNDKADMKIRDFAKMVLFLRVLFQNSQYATIRDLDDVLNLSSADIVRCYMQMHTEN